MEDIEEERGGLMHTLLILVYMETQTGAVSKEETPGPNEVKESDHRILL